MICLCRSTRHGRICSHICTAGSHIIVALNYDESQQHCDSISREQVEVFPNFAMTDYASQGKTRPINIVDLNNCSGHQSYYTCWSRSASAADTIILQGFD
jgi:hypothetical protein